MSWASSLRVLLLAVVVGAMNLSARAADPWVVYDGCDGPGKGKHIVLVSGDEEYRSEEALPQLAKILAKHHGFKCTVLFAIDPKDGTINPNDDDNIPGLEALKTADLMIIFTRFRDLPDDQMKHIVDYVEAGKPIIGLRTATHAFKHQERQDLRQVLLTTARSKATRAASAGRCSARPGSAITAATASRARAALIVKGQENNPILRGIKDGDIWGPTDVYERPSAAAGRQQAAGAGPGAGGHETDRQAGRRQEERSDDAGRLDEDLFGDGRQAGQGLHDHDGLSQDLESEGLRRLLVNATYWAVGLEDKISAKANVDLVGEYKPSPFRGGGYVKGVKPADLAIK